MDRHGRVRFGEWSWDESGHAAGKVEYCFESAAALGV